MNVLDIYKKAQEWLDIAEIQLFYKEKVLKLSESL